MTNDTKLSHIYIDADLHRQAKIAAVTAGSTLMDWIETAIRARLDPTPADQEKLLLAAFRGLDAGGRRLILQGVGVES